MFQFLWRSLITKQCRSFRRRDWHRPRTKGFCHCIKRQRHIKNINKSARLKKLERQLIREQRCLSRKYENLKKGDVTQRANIQKQKLKVQKLHHRIDNIRTDYINKTIAEMVKTKPSYITIEDLNVKGMMKNRHLSKAVASQKFYEFRAKLQTQMQ